MMIYPQRNRQQKKNPFWLIFGVALVVVAFIWGLQMFAGKMVGRVAMTIGSPFSSVYTAFKNKLTFTGSFIGSRASLVEQNRKLRADIVSNAAKLLRFDTLLHEHEELLAAYGRSQLQGLSARLVLGNVIAKPPQTPYDVLVVDIGSVEGVKTGSQVYGIGGIPLGRVQETAAGTSKVLMFSSNGEESQVVHTRTNVTLTVVGTGGGNLETEVAQDVDIVVGDTVTLPQFNGAVVASVVAIDTSVASASKKILLQIPVNIFNIRWVEITQ